MKAINTTPARPKFFTAQTVAIEYDAPEFATAPTLQLGAVEPALETLESCAPTQRNAVVAIGTLAPSYASDYRPHPMGAYSAIQAPQAPQAHKVVCLDRVLWNRAKAFVSKLGAFCDATTRGKGDALAANIGCGWSQPIPRTAPKFAVAMAWYAAGTILRNV